MVFSRENGCFGVLRAKKHQIPAVWCVVWIAAPRVAVPGEGLLGGIWEGNGVFLPHKLVIFGFRGSSVLAGKHFPTLRAHFDGFFS